MDRALDFTVNPNEFSGLSEFAHNLHEVDLSIFLHITIFITVSMMWDILH